MQAGGEAFEGQNLNSNTQTTRGTLQFSHVPALRVTENEN